MVPKTVLFEGDEDEDLICGKCGGILGRGVTRKTAFLRFASPSGRLVIVCPSCTANNALKVTRAGP
jgi:RNase P subunit RPR2